MLSDPVFILFYLVSLPPLIKKSHPEIVGLCSAETAPEMLQPAVTLMHTCAVSAGNTLYLPLTSQSCEASNGAAAALPSAALSSVMASDSCLVWNLATATLGFLSAVCRMHTKICAWCGNVFLFFSFFNVHELHQCFGSPVVTSACEHFT